MIDTQKPPAPQVPTSPAPSVPVAPMEGSVASAATTPPASPPKKPGLPKNTILLIGGILLLSLVVFSFLFLQSNQTQQSAEPEEIVPTEVLTPTPLPNLSRISTTSAFRAFREEVASFSAVLNTFTLQDPAFTPPVFETELGLQN